MILEERYDSMMRRLDLPFYLRGFNRLAPLPPSLQTDGPRLRAETETMTSRYFGGDRASCDGATPRTVDRLSYPSSHVRKPIGNRRNLIGRIWFLPILEQGYMRMTHIACKLGLALIEFPFLFDLVSRNIMLIVHYPHWEPSFLLPPRQKRITRG